jgi:hypothetical protein
MGQRSNGSSGEEPGRSPGQPDQPANAIARAILDIVAAVPATSEGVSALPANRARSIRAAACLRAAAVSGTLALPPGPLGLVTILPDLAAVWRIQAQMVADLAGAYGKSATLSQEQMLYCLFRHAAAQVVRDLAMRIGERIVFKQVTISALQALARRLGVNVTQRVIAKSVARWLPIVGAVGVAGYAYYDTAKVGVTAVELFEKEVALDEDDQARSSSA